MIFTILVPEYIVGKALNELVANDQRGQMADATAPYPRTTKRWDRITAYMADMGYFAVDFGDFWDMESDSTDVERLVEEDHPILDRCNTKPASKGYSLREEVRLMMEDDTRAASIRLNISRLAHPYWVLTSDQLNVLVPHILDPPGVHVRQLEVLNRGDSLVKILALVQIIYLIIQLVARKVAHLPSAQLEIAALAFSASSFITYVLYWSRPQGVESIHILKPKCAPSKTRITRIASRGPVFLWTKHRPEHDFAKLYDLQPIPNDGMRFTSRVVDTKLFIGDNDELLVLALGAFFGGTIFGAIHCLAWNFHFPTHGEALTWRVCSVMTSVLPMLSVFPLFMWMRLHPWDEKPKQSQALRFAFGLTFVFCFMVPYILARIFLVVEMFRSLCFLPPEVFVDTWSGSFPHLG